MRATPPKRANSSTTRRTAGVVDARARASRRCRRPAPPSPKFMFDSGSRSPARMSWATSSRRGPTGLPRSTTTERTPRSEQPRGAEEPGRTGAQDHRRQGRGLHRRRLGQRRRRGLHVGGEGAAEVSGELHLQAHQPAQVTLLAGVERAPQHGDLARSASAQPQALGRPAGEQLVGLLEPERQVGDAVAQAVQVSREAARVPGPGGEVCAIPGQFPSGFPLTPDGRCR